jgi:hypothetical protein
VQRLLSLWCRCNQNLIRIAEFILQSENGLPGSVGSGSEDEENQTRQSGQPEREWGSIRHDAQLSWLHWLSCLISFINHPMT